MKKRGLAAALAMLTMATTGTAFAATNYWIPVYYNNEGYNSTPVNFDNINIPLEFIL